MVYIFLTIALILFALCFKAMKLVPVTKQIIVDSNTALAVIRSAELTDAEKETGTRRAAVAMIGSLVTILARSAVCLLVPVAFVWLLARVGIYAESEAVAAASNWIFVAASSLAMLGLVVLSK